MLNTHHRSAYVPNLASLIFLGLCLYSGIFESDVAFAQGGERVSQTNQQQQQRNQPCLPELVEACDGLPEHLLKLKRDVVIETACDYFCKKKNPRTRFELNMCKRMCKSWVEHKSDEYKANQGIEAAGNVCSAIANFLELACEIPSELLGGTWFGSRQLRQQQQQQQQQRRQQQR